MDAMQEKNATSSTRAVDERQINDSQDEINVSGHKQELDRNFSLLSICGLGITTGNTWVAMGGSITTAIFNGGPPGVIYEFMTVTVCYFFVAASLAELASAIPSSAVYHWATAAAGRHGRPVGWLAGFWNCLAWIFATASISAIIANMTVSMYMLFHPDLEVQAWHIFVSFIICTWLCCLIVLFANRVLPRLSNIGTFFTLAGVTITILVCAIMPYVNGVGYASHNFVWRDWRNETGWKNDRIVFLLGMLNGAYSVGCCDLTSHLAEEIPSPKKNIPKAIFAQMVTGAITAIPFMIALFYAINDMEAVLTTNSTFPLTTIYHQATGSRGGAVGLQLLAFIPTVITLIGCYVTCGRTLWTLARDKAVPLSSFISRIHPTRNNPFNSTLVCGCVVTCLGCIYVGSTTAFNAFIGSFVQLSSLSYLAAILPYMLRGRCGIGSGPFSMSGRVGYVVNGFSCLYIVTFVVIFSFPFSMPTSAASMNYVSVMTWGLTLLGGIWYLVRSKSYVGPDIKLHI